MKRRRKGIEGGLDWRNSIENDRGCEGGREFLRQIESIENRERQRCRKSLMERDEREGEREIGRNWNLVN